MCLKCVAQAAAELVGIRSHAKLLLFAQNGLFSFRVPQAHKAIGKISRNVVGKSVGNASAGIPCENRVQIGGAFASHAGDFNLVLALEKAHAKARANLGCEGRTIKERNKKLNTLSAPWPFSAADHLRRWPQPSYRERILNISS